MLKTTVKSLNYCISSKFLTHYNSIRTIWCHQLQNRLQTKEIVAGWCLICSLFLYFMFIYSTLMFLFHLFLLFQGNFRTFFIPCNKIHMYIKLSIQRFLFVISYFYLFTLHCLCVCVCIIE